MAPASAAKATVTAAAAAAAAAAVAAATAAAAPPAASVVASEPALPLKRGNGKHRSASKNERIVQGLDWLTRQRMNKNTLEVERPECTRTTECPTSVAAERMSLLHNERSRSPVGLLANMV